MLIFFRAGVFSAWGTLIVTTEGFCPLSFAPYRLPFLSRRPSYYGRVSAQASIQAIPLHRASRLFLASISAGQAGKQWQCGFFTCAGSVQVGA
jgi:hypothetical protein